MSSAFRQNDVYEFNISKYHIKFWNQNLNTLTVSFNSSLIFLGKSAIQILQSTRMKGWKQCNYRNIMSSEILKKDENLILSENYIT
jgi:hypothetical protein